MQLNLISNKQLNTMLENNKEDINIFEGISNQDISISILKSSIKKNRVAPAYIFAGPKGVGQKEIAIRFAEGLTKDISTSKNLRSRLEGFNHPDILWVEPTYINQGEMITLSAAKANNYSSHKPPQIRLEQIKEVIKFLGRHPIELKYGIVIIENAEAMNEASSNAMLKTLEEPKSGIIILIAEKPDSLISTIHSRCQLITFQSLNNEELKVIAKEFLIDNNFESPIEDYLKAILSISNGSPELLIENINSFKEIPNDILKMIKDLSKDQLIALKLAKKITDEISSYNQIWLISLLQQLFWIKNYNSPIVKRLEKLRIQLFSFVNPRLAWEIALIEISSLKDNFLQD